MKKYFTGLCMAWGNFCYIPCPKKWDENARSLMLGWLPFIGLVIGVIWAAVYFGLVYLSFPYLFVVFIMTFAPFILSGFIHVDGFMDCSDALLSRGTLEKKQAILKDSRCGMFAIITIIFTVLCMYSCLGSSVSVGIDFVNLVVITVCSRSVAGLEVLLSEPMNTSQYKNMHVENELTDEVTVEVTGEPIGEFTAELTDEPSDDADTEDNNEIADISENESEEDTKTEAEEKPVGIKQGVYLLCTIFLICLALFGLCCTYYLSTALVVVATVIGSLISAKLAKKGLGGMNGDIAGYSIVWGELMGIVMLAIV